MADINVYTDADIYGPVQRAQAFKEQQNALARQNAVRNALASSIDPATGLTNWQFARQIGGPDVAPELQGLQQADLMAQTELNSKRALSAKANVDADKQWLANAREQYASGVFDQRTHTAWRNQVVSEKPFLAQFIPEVFDPKTTRQQILTTADNAMPDVSFQTTGAGVEGIDVRPTSPTFGQTLVKREAPPRSPGFTIQMPAAETAFGKGLGESASQNLQESFKGARSASSSFSNIERLAPLVNSQAFISGTLGDTRLAISKALGLEGAEETQTFFSQMGRETAEVIKAFGAGTGLSDADRQYAEKIAGGNIDLTPGAIKRILFLRQQANRAAILRYNDDRRAFAVNNPKVRVDQYYQEIPVPPPPAFNYKGWRLETDKDGNMAYVSPDRKSFQETR